MRWSYEEFLREDRDWFANVLRVLAAILITNTHYATVYPFPALASGGLLGDVVFFAVSGYGIYRIRQPFASWYRRRLWRIYPAVWGISAVYVVLRFYQLSSMAEYLEVFIWPTRYHFVASILLMYIACFVCFSTRCIRENLPKCMAMVAIAFLVYYMVAYDKSVYQIDNVRLREIRVLFFEAMLFGGYCREHRERLLNHRRWWSLISVASSFAVYLASKFLFVHFRALAPFQVLNWLFLFLALASLFTFMMGLEDRLRAIPRWGICGIGALSAMTLEIYVVQYELIPRLADVAPFPLNFVVVTLAILVSALALHVSIEAVRSKMAGVAQRSTLHTR